MYSLRRKLYTNPTQTLHSEHSKPCTATLHSNPTRQPCTATLHGNPTQQPYTATLHGNPAQQPYTATLHGNPTRQPCTATLHGNPARTARWQARLSSLEGCTVSNRGQRPRTAATPSVSAWKAVRPRRWRREPPRRRRILR